MRSIALLPLLLAGCFPETADFGGSVDTGLPYVLEDQGLGVLPTEGDCSELFVSLVADQQELNVSYTQRLGVTPIPQLDFEARTVVLAWVEGCYGDEAELVVDSVVDEPDALVVHYVLTSSKPTGTNRLTPYALISVARSDYQSVQATAELPAR